MKFYYSIAIDRIVRIERKKCRRFSNISKVTNIKCRILLNCGISCGVIKDNNACNVLKKKQIIKKIAHSLCILFCSDTHSVVFVCAHNAIKFEFQLNIVVVIIRLSCDFCRCSRKKAESLSLSLSIGLKREEWISMDYCKSLNELTASAFQFSSSKMHLYFDFSMDRCSIC